MVAFPPSQVEEMVTESVVLTDKNFTDWHADVFGYGYGSGEEHWLPALHRFFAELVGRDEHRRTSYDHSDLERAFGPLAAWLLINALCMAEVLEYGSSPRYGWLTKRGELLRAYVAAHTVESLGQVVMVSSNGAPCLPDYCNCDGVPESCNPLYRQAR